LNLNNEFALDDLYKIIPLFFTAVILMAIAYFLPFSQTNVLFLIFSTFFFSIAISIQVNKNSYFFSIYLWSVFYFFFPKKPLVSGLDSVLELLVNLPIEISNNVYFSFYDIINSIILIAILNKVLKNKFENKTGQKLIKIFSSLILIALIQNIFYNIFLVEKLGSNFLEQYHFFLQLFSGLIFSSIIYLSLKNTKQINYIFSLAILSSLITAFEYYLAITGLLPDVLKYFILDYRGGLRSLIHSGSLMSGHILFIGFLGLLRKRSFYSLTLIFLLIPPAFFTYERSVALLFIITAIIFSINTFYISRENFLRFSLVGAISILLISPLIFQFNSSIAENFDSTLNQSQYADSRIKSQGWFTFQSSDDRFSMALRGLDIFYKYPVLGCGPGNIRLMMGFQEVIPHANIFFMNQRTIQGYFDNINGYHISNAHNIYINFLAELGIVGIFILFQLIKIIFKESKKYGFLLNKNIIGISGIISFMFYGLFQVTPLSFPVILFLFRTMEIDST
tara:strand:+ start:2597 stop:4117 length:1521 start_codon:yes stop_codon:yes gene_type:complete